MAQTSASWLSGGPAYLGVPSCLEPPGAPRGAMHAGAELGRCRGAMPLWHMRRYCHMTAGRSESSGNVLTPTFCRPLPIEDICAMNAKAEPYARCQSGHVSWLSSIASRVAFAKPAPCAAIVSVMILSTMLGGALPGSATQSSLPPASAQPGQRTPRADRLTPLSKRRRQGRVKTGRVP